MSVIAWGADDHRAKPIEVVALLAILDRREG
jgi:hypothetical protein